MRHLLKTDELQGVSGLYRQLPQREGQVGPKKQGLSMTCVIHLLIFALLCSPVMVPLRKMSHRITRSSRWVYEAYPVKTNCRVPV